MIYVLPHLGLAVLVSGGEIQRGHNVGHRGDRAKWVLLVARRCVSVMWSLIARGGGRLQDQQVLEVIPCIPVGDLHTNDHRGRSRSRANASCSQPGWQASAVTQLPRRHTTMSGNDQELSEAEKVSPRTAPADVQMRLKRLARLGGPSPATPSPSCATPPPDAATQGSAASSSGSRLLSLGNSNQSASPVPSHHAADKPKSPPKAASPAPAPRVIKKPSPAISRTATPSTRPAASSMAVQATPSIPYSQWEASTVATTFSVTLKVSDGAVGPRLTVRRPSPRRVTGSFAGSRASRRRSLKRVQVSCHHAGQLTDRRPQQAGCVAGHSRQAADRAFILRPQRHGYLVSRLVASC